MGCDHIVYANVEYGSNIKKDVQYLMARAFGGKKKFTSDGIK